MLKGMSPDDIYKSNDFLQCDVRENAAEAERGAVDFLLLTLTAVVEIDSTASSHKYIYKDIRLNL